ncbi:MAG TPA: hypothetical protein ENH00_11760 [Actinobacteria bacterium]|nr:hypothetical protein [Actinomycetota bacterium]
MSTSAPPVAVCPHSWMASFAMAAASVTSYRWNRPPGSYHEQRNIVSTKRGKIILVERVRVTLDRVVGRGETDWGNRRNGRQGMMRATRGGITRLTVLMLTVSLVAAACANDVSGMGKEEDATLILDFVPGGIHAGIYSALAEGYFDDANINIDIEPPTSSADTLRLVLAGKATIGIAPIADVASLRARGEDIQIFMAMEQVPLVALISTAAIGVTDPSQLTGATIGVTGVPSDEAIARVILSNSGVDLDTVEFVTIGFDAVGNLIGQTVDAAIGFWSSEAVALELQGETPYVFRPDEYGAPPYPELVFFAGRDTIENRPEILRAFARAVARGYRFALNNQDTAIADLAANADGIDVEFATAEFNNVKPYYLGPNGKYGEISDEAIADYLTWADEVGVLESMPENLVTTEFLP